MEREMTDTSTEAVEALARDHDRVGNSPDLYVMGHPHHWKTAATLRALAAERDALKARAEAAEAEVARLREALTPSGDTKAAYMGEIKDPETKRHVSWTAIKMIMSMISARAALQGDKP
jgi:hypothetical protein